jgi:hypothetical protein
VNPREGIEMMMHTTLEQLRELRLHGMVAGLTEQLTSTVKLPLSDGHIIVLR